MAWLMRWFNRNTVTLYFTSQLLDIYRIQMTREKKNMADDKYIKDSQPWLLVSQSRS